MTAGVRKTDHVLKSVYKHAQKDKKEVRFCKKKRRFYHKPPFSGLDGSRTRVRNTIPCPSTSVVYYLTFPLPHDNKQPCGFSSFMIRPMAQSFANVVSHIVEAWVLKCECSRSAAIRQRMLNYLQRLILIWPFNASPYDSLLQLHVPRRNLY